MAGRFEANKAAMVGYILLHYYTTLLTNTCDKTYLLFIILLKKTMGACGRAQTRAWHSSTDNK